MPSSGLAWEDRKSSLAGWDSGPAGQGWDGLAVACVGKHSAIDCQAARSRRQAIVALICLEKQCLGVFRGFSVVFSWLFRGFSVALILGKFYAYSPWKSLLIIVVRRPQPASPRVYPPTGRIFFSATPTLRIFSSCAPAEARR